MCLQFPESSAPQHLSYLQTSTLRHINMAPTLTLHCKPAQYFDAVKPLRILQTPVTTSLLGIVSLLKRSMKPGYLC